MPKAQGERLKVVEYMDDITIVSTDSRFNAMATKVFVDYCAVTGTLDKMDKSELFLSRTGMRLSPPLSLSK